MEQKKRPGLGRLALLLCTMIWGSAFVLMKTALDDIDPFWLLAIRFTMAALLLLAMSAKELKKMDKGYLLGAIPVGFAVAAAYVLQTVGLVYTTPGKNAFLTAVYCVFTPFLYWLLRHRGPDKYNFIAAVLCLVSVGLISLDADLSMNIGDVLTLGCGLFFALHIIVLDRYAEGRSTLLVTALQFTYAAAFMWILSFLFGTPPTHISGGTWAGLVYLAVLSTAVCFVLQTYGQQNTPPSQAAILLSLEAVFGTVASVLFYHEVLETKVVIGFAGMFITVIISETKLSFLKRRSVDDAAQ